MNKLKDLIKEYETLFLPGGIQQSVEELEQLIGEIKNKKFTSMCEIGIADGGTLWLYTQLFGTKGMIVTITDMDIRPIVHKIMEELNKRMDINFDIHECQGDQFKLTRPVQFLHIDGDHSYEAVARDFYTNNNMVQEGGYIVIHDTMLMAGPIRFRLELEGMGINMKTFGGTTVLCDCFAPNRGNPKYNKFGMTVIIK